MESISITSSTGMNLPKATRNRGNRTSLYQKKAIVEWLEEPTNFNMIVGKSSGVICYSIYYAIIDNIRST